MKRMNPSSDGVASALPAISSQYVLVLPTEKKTSTGTLSLNVNARPLRTLRLTAIMPSLLGLGGCDMDWWVPIVVALITGPVAVLLQMLRRENTQQHSESRELLHHMIIKVDDIHDDVNELKQDFNKHTKDDHVH